MRVNKAPTTLGSNRTPLLVVIECRIPVDVHGHGCKKATCRTHSFRSKMRSLVISTPIRRLHFK